jgi:hypothetical protein
MTAPPRRQHKLRPSYLRARTDFSPISVRVLGLLSGLARLSGLGLGVEQ